jgi:hypothetical protein
LDDEEEETPDASSIRFRFVGGVLLAMIEWGLVVSPLFRVKKKISLVASDFNRDTSVALATKFHHRGKVVCFSIVDDDDERREMMAPGRRSTKARKKEASESFFFLSFGREKKRKRRTKSFFFWCQECLLFF